MRDYHAAPVIRIPNSALSLVSGIPYMLVHIHHLYLSLMRLTSYKAGLSYSIHRHTETLLKFPATQQTTFAPIKDLTD